MEEWVWSGQMCSNVFWLHLCKDKNTSTHTQLSQPTYLLSTALCYSVFREKNKVICFLFPSFSASLFQSFCCLTCWFHNTVSWLCMQTCMNSQTCTHTFPVYMERNLMCHPTVRCILCCWFQPITQLESWWPICPHDWLMDAPECVCVRACACVCVSAWKGLTRPQTHLASDNFLLLPATTSIFRERHRANASPWTT